MENILLSSFEDFGSQLLSVWSVAGDLWFIIFPPALYFVFKLLWMDHIQDSYFGQLSFVLLEIVPPREIEKSPKVMETFFDGILGSDKGPNIAEKFVQGFFPASFSLEMAGDGNGNAHLYIRTQRSFRNLVEAYLYAQYPEIEIFEVPDYVDDIPKGAPNREIDLWGVDFEFTRPDPYPIKTYHFYQEDITGKMIDPLAGLLETIGKLPHGQRIWLQYIISPESPTFYNTGQALLQERIGRTVKEKPKSMFGELGKHLSDVIINIPKALFGPVEFAEANEKPEKKDFLEFQLTPIEKEVVKALETNIGKGVFNVRMRMIYVGKKKGFDRSFLSAFIGGLKQFNDGNYNGFKPNDDSKTYANYLFAQSRLRYRQRRSLRRYKLRDSDPSSTKLIMSTAELATLFHVPDMNVVAPSLSRVASKRGSAPQNLPI